MKSQKSKTIKINCTGSAMMKLADLEVIQGKLKKLSPENEVKLRKRIENYGFDAPFFVWKKKILDGTQRKAVLLKMIEDGWTLPGGKVPVCDIKAKNLNDAKQRLLGYISQYGKIDSDGLDEFLKSIEVPDIGTLDLPDFDFDKFDAVYINPPSEGLTDDDAVPEPPKKAKTKTGDLYVLGNHRLLCGDSTKAEDVKRLMDGEKADMVMGDPPYNVRYTGGSSNKKERADSYGDKWTDEEYSKWLRKVLLCAQSESDDKAALCLWFSDSKMRAVMDAIEGAGWRMRNQIIWNKLKAHYGALGAQYKERKEPMWYCHKKGKSPNWHGATNECTVWDCDQPHSNDLHPTMKPVELYERSIKNHTMQNNIILEIFSGSGTTLIAAEKLNRRCFGMEIDPVYCDVIVKRWEEFTGKKAKLQKRK